MALAVVGSCHVTSSLHRARIDDFRGFIAYVIELSIFVHEICMVARSDRVLPADIKDLTIKAIVPLECRLTVLVLAIF